jgi:5-methyltetrahydrofolate--homocysteine methyltransferase
MNVLAEFVQQEGALVLDGAMGTMLFAAGLTSGGSPEEWNVSHPERIEAIHQAYVDAGSQIILTNSFGGTRYRLKLHGLEKRVVELNRGAAQNARAVADRAPQRVLVAGSMGPTGELMEPMGAMTYDACRAAFAEQAQGLVEGGVDVLWIETMSDLQEVKAAIEGARLASTDIPVCATLSFDTRGRTMMGVTGAQVVRELGGLGLTAIGANCGNNLPDTEAALAEMRAALAAAHLDILLIAKANAGMPQWEGEKLVYNGTPEVMAAYAHRVREHGVQLIGGCCGSGPAHIALMRQVLDGALPVPDTQVAAPGDVAAAAGDGGDRTRVRRVRRG